MPAFYTDWPPRRALFLIRALILHEPHDRILLNTALQLVSGPIKTRAARKRVNQNRGKITLRSHLLVLVWKPLLVSRTDVQQHGLQHQRRFIAVKIGKQLHPVAQFAAQLVGHGTP